jgi:hypothetical protein
VSSSREDSATAAVKEAEGSAEAGWVEAGWAAAATEAEVKAKAKEEEVTAAATQRTLQGRG